MRLLGGKWAYNSTERADELHRVGKAREMPPSYRNEPLPRSANLRHILLGHLEGRDVIVSPLDHEKWDRDVESQFARIEREDGREELREGECQTGSPVGHVTLRRSRWRTNKLSLD